MLLLLLALPRAAAAHAFHAGCVGAAAGTAAAPAAAAAAAGVPPATCLTIHDITLTPAVEFAAASCRLRVTGKPLLGCLRVCLAHTLPAWLAAAVASSSRECADSGC